MAQSVEQRLRLLKESGIGTALMVTQEEERFHQELRNLYEILELVVRDIDKIQDNLDPANKINIGRLLKPIEERKNIASKAMKEATKRKDRFSERFSRSERHVARTPSTPDGILNTAARASKHAG